MKSQAARNLPLSRRSPNEPPRPSLPGRAVRRASVGVLALALLLPPAGLVWAHASGGGGGGAHTAGHASAGGGAHFGGGGAHFGGGAHLSSPAPRFNGAARYGAPAARFGARAPSWNASSSRGYANRTPYYGASSRGTVTARAGIAPRSPIAYGRFAVGRGGAYGQRWDGGYWHGHYWPPVYYRPDFAWFLPVLPPYCVTYWWGGVPYYYYNEAYYTWDPGDGGYVATEPPPISDDADADGAAAYPEPPPPTDGSYGVTYGSPDANAPDTTAPSPPAYNGAAPPYDGPPPAYNGAPGAAGDNLYAYPSNGQSPEQQAQDQRECAQWAQSQSPASANGGSMDYKRALTACLSGRGYSVD